MGVMFPAFSTGYAQNPERTARLFGRSVKVLFLVLFPIVLCAVALAQDGLKLWLGADFAQHSFRVFQFLAIGVFINCLSLVPYTFVQGVGRPDLSARVHLIELPLYVALLWWMIRTHGIEGAAVAWTLRVMIDALLLFILSRRLLLNNELMRLREHILPVAALLTLVVAAFLSSPVAKAAFLFVTILAFGMLMWFRVFTPDERRLAQSYRLKFLPRSQTRETFSGTAL